MVFEVENYFALAFLVVVDEIGCGSDDGDFVPEDSFEFVSVVTVGKFGGLQVEHTAHTQSALVSGKSFAAYSALARKEKVYDVFNGVEHVLGCCGISGGWQRFVLQNKYESKPSIIC